MTIEDQCDVLIKSGTRLTTAECLHLIQEIKRLKSGAFTPEEFQNLCHDKYPCSRQVFEQGCLEYQNRVFGSK